MLPQYDDVGFQDLPAQLRNTIKSRPIMFKRRTPTEHERNETIQDAKEHRHLNNEMTMQDYKDKYNGKKFTLK